MKRKKRICLILSLIILLGLSSSSTGQSYGAVTDYGTEISPIQAVDTIRQIFDSGKYQMNIIISGDYFVELSGEPGEDKYNDILSGSSGGSVVTGRGGKAGLGGFVTGYVHLEAGDRLYITIGDTMAGGAINPDRIGATQGGRGGDAVDIRIGGTELTHIAMLAGGGGGGAGIGMFTMKIGSSYYGGYSSGKDGMPGGNLIEKEIFSDKDEIGGGGSGGNGSYGKKGSSDYAFAGGPGKNGGPNATGGLGGITYEPIEIIGVLDSEGGNGGKSFVNTTLVTGYHAQAGISTLKSVRISMAREVSGGEMDMNLVPKPIITVAEGVPFHTFIACYDDITSAVVDGVTFVNNDKTDGIVEISGCLKSGRKKVIKDEHVIWFYVIPAPKASTIHITFN